MSKQLHRWKHLSARLKPSATGFTVHRIFLPSHWLPSLLNGLIASMPCHSPFYLNILASLRTCVNLQLIVLHSSEYHTKQKNVQRVCARAIGYCMLLVNLSSMKCKLQGYCAWAPGVRYTCTYIICIHSCSITCIFNLYSKSGMLTRNSQL